MKLLRFGPKGYEKPGMLDANSILRDLSGLLPDLTADHLGRAALDKLASVEIGRAHV